MFCLFALGASVVFAGPAQAATQIGQVSPGEPEACNVGNIPQLATAGEPTYTVPSDGVITEWSHRGLTAYPGSGGLQIWRPAGGSSYTLVGKSAIESFSAGFNSFSADLPVKAGDQLGLRVDSSGTGCYFIGAEGDVAGDGDSSDPAPGETRALSAVNYVQANVSATFEDPDTVPPETTITSGPAGATGDSSPSFGFSSSEAGPSFSRSLNNSPGAACSSPKSYANLRDGNYTFSVRATDPAGNTDSTAAVRSFTVPTQRNSGPRMKPGIRT